MPKFGIKINEFNIEENTYEIYKVCATDGQGESLEKDFSQ